LKEWQQVVVIVAGKKAGLRLVRADYVAYAAFVHRAGESVNTGAEEKIRI
jgi:hypothetical protein